MKGAKIYFKIKKKGFYNLVSTFMIISLLISIVSTAFFQKFSIILWVFILQLPSLIYIFKWNKRMSLVINEMQIDGDYVLVKNFSVYNQIKIHINDIEAKIYDDEVLLFNKLTNQIIGKAKKSFLINPNDWNMLKSYFLPASPSI